MRGRGDCHVCPEVRFGVRLAGMILLSSLRLLGIFPLCLCGQTTYAEVLKRLFLCGMVAESKIPGVGEIFNVLIC